MSIEERIMKLVENLSGRPSEAIRTAQDFSDIGLDSIDHPELMFNLEDEFNIEIPDGDFEKMRSFSTTVEYITQRLA